MEIEKDKLSHFWNLTSNECLTLTQSNRNGLSEEEAKKRLLQFGENKLSSKKETTAIGLFFSQFKSPIVLLLLFAAGLSVIVQDSVDAIIILGIVFLSGLLGFWQEKGAMNAVRKLLAMVQIRVSVMRNSSIREIPSEEVVPGDILKLSAGDMIPADCILLESKDLFVNEATLTGETFPIEKFIETISKNSSLSIGVFDSFLGGALFKVQIPIYAPIHIEETEQPVKTEEFVPALMSSINELKKSKIETKELTNSYNRSKVLIVEDNAEMRKYIFNTLCDDFNLSMAVDGKQGLEKAILEKPDIIVTDIMMPVMSGDQMLKELKKIPELSGTYILFLSAKSDQNFRIKLLQEGAHDYLIKPFTPEELNVKVHNFSVLKKTIETLENANADMESFSYSVSHDLRAPILVIEGFLQIILEDFSEKMDPEALRSLKIVHKNVVYMNHLIQDLLSFHKVSKIDLPIRLIEMDKMVQDVIATVLQNYPKKNYLFQVDELPNALANGAALKQVWMNLISNAVKYSSTRETPFIKIGFEEMDGFNNYFIEDNGVGFNKAYSNKLFKVFQRLHTQEEFEGTGVGLAIVSKIVQRHGGQVFAEGEVNKGSKFSFTLPKLSRNENV